MDFMKTYTKCHKCIRKTESRILCAGGNDMKVWNCIALIITIIGAINWGLIGLFDFNLVTFLFGVGSIITRIVYILVGICGIYLLTFFSKLDED